MSLSLLTTLTSSFSFFLLLLSIYPSPFSAAQRNPSSSSFSISNSPWRADQNHTLLSPNSTFAAGFLPQNNSVYFFSIWYYGVRDITVVWSVRSPLNPSTSLEITRTGELRLTNSGGDNLWPGKAAVGLNSTKLVIRDNGNLVFGDWESFSYPTDTFLPNQTINGRNLTSKNGNYNFAGSNSNLIYNGSDVYGSAGGVFQQLTLNGTVTVVGTGTPLYSSDFGTSNFLRRLTLENNGNLIIYSFHRNSGRWIAVWQAVQQICTIPGLCGPNFICFNNGSDDSISCECPFLVTKTGECSVPYTNPGTSKFIGLDYVNYTGLIPQGELTAPNFTVCESRCLAYPRCLGFGFKYDGTGYCVLQLGKLLNGYWSPDTQSTMYLRVDPNATPSRNFTGMTELLETTCPNQISLPYPPKESNTTTRNVVTIVFLFAMELVIGGLSFWAFFKKYVKYRDMARTLGLELMPVGGPKRFRYADIKAATGDFSDDNLIGRGGFSDVYKGVLPDHRVVAVKCLKNVAGGGTEFWAEVTIIARMHHLNLVRLWGFCNEKDQRILVYEYIPNGSLNEYLFRSSIESGPEEGPILDWETRYRIALGVARAIAYLHEECLEWVLHCDINPENILIGEDFCPKLSDFGLSKMRRKEQAVTVSRMRGTRGYMAPEWRNSGPISPKADVYSFGLVLLEIVSGTRNFDQPESSLESSEWYFPRWAFDKAVRENKLDEILDGKIKQWFDSKLHLKMVERMVQTAMWCLQERPDMRPSMGKVTKMLEGTVEIIEAPRPTIFYSPDL
ncbi:hypothetical protein Nepgr_016990 [Nepenthes gracilis]|uniref:Receptor-like serine/threonine-protein kinase n=1 Tax=Nepenthes gracilis TaxID=150966 RepID=A0AAD3XSN5_NEPGR|nr:hypothetical protein Nepgr_016990 [Nepenthes gracilis]